MKPEIPRDAPAQRPTRAELEAARGREVADVVAPGLYVLFCGINPGLYSGAVGHHFARPGNRFWRALHGGGFTPRVLQPWEERRLLDYGLGVTNLVPYATARAEELPRGDLREGGRALEEKTAALLPRFVAFLGVAAFRAAFARPHAIVGPQPVGIGRVRAWLLPNPSGVNAHWQLPELAELFAALRRAVPLPDRRS